MSAEFLTKNFGIPRECIVPYHGLSLEEQKKKVLAANGGKTFDVAMDFFGGMMKKLCVETLGLHGQLVTIVQENDPKNTNIPLFNAESPKNLFQINGSCHLVYLGGIALSREHVHEIRCRLDELSTAIMKKEFKLPPMEVIGKMSVDTVKKAHQLLEEHRAKVKLVATW